MPLLRAVRREAEVVQNAGTFSIASQSRPRYGHRRATHCFPSQKEAKKFARSKMTEADHIAAGTLNPHLPNTVIAQKGGSDPRGGEAI